MYVDRKQIRYGGKEMYNSRPKQTFSFDNGVFNSPEKIIEQLNSIDFDVILFEVYPGVDLEVLYETVIRKIHVAHTLSFDDCYKEPSELTSLLAPYLTEDDVFGKFSFHEPSELVVLEKIESLKKQVEEKRKSGKVLLFGTGVTQFFENALTIYITITRREVEERLDKGMTNWRADNSAEHINRKIKRAYYFDWPFADGIKESCLPAADYIIDMTSPAARMVSNHVYHEILSVTAQRPFRLVPYFASGVWGGHWIQENFGIGKEEVNIAWGFDGVPEENSLLFELNQTLFEFPAQDLIYLYPKESLGEKVLGRYGKEFPIRFDYLDTIGGQNLSLQVHPETDYAYKKFNAKYTQDESYYIMKSTDEAVVYLGVKDDVDAAELFEALKKAKETNQFSDEKFISSIKVKEHDHILIPAGTIHSSGTGCLVLEISATPNRFTFKLWDWDRVDLDGKPRPIHLEHGEKNINMAMNASYTKQHLYNAVETVKNSDSHLVERTGLHISEPIETIRDSFSVKTTHYTNQNVQMICLVEGEEIIVETYRNQQKERLVIHYGETFIIPASVQMYTMEPAGNSIGKTVKTMKAFIR